MRQLRPVVRGFVGAARFRRREHHLGLAVRPAALRLRLSDPEAGRMTARSSSSSAAVRGSDRAARRARDRLDAGFLTQRARADDRRDRHAHARRAAARHSLDARIAISRRSIRREPPTSRFSTIAKYLGPRYDARRRLPVGAAFRRGGAGAAGVTGHGQALSGLCRRGACAVSGELAAIIVVRDARTRRGSAHASHRAAGSRRHGRSVRRHRTGAEIGAGTLVAAGAVIGRPSRSAAIAPSAPSRPSRMP